MTADQVEAIVRRVMEQEAPKIAQATVKEFFRVWIGVNTDNEESVDRWRANHAHLDRMREAAETQGKAISNMVVTVLVSACCTAAGAWALGLLKLGIKG